MNNPLDTGRKLKVHMTLKRYPGRLMNVLCTFNIRFVPSKKRHDMFINKYNINDCNWTRTHNHLVCKRTLNHLAKLVSLAKWLSVFLRTK